ncbi:Alcohol dehydrogenase zinc-binding domain protein [Pseudomonas syringae pv. actinidiae]|uniref:Alcohol dehydrogenase zinc-binding domain protein n=2 Tax=Pseudomonas syringae TaxID=317 RepID=A0A7Z6UMS3_PSESF|nr:Alcohol dehydrogenase zinc-binding domain protein [Pseudomonas syringae pv. actinidiae]
MAHRFQTPRLPRDHQGPSAIGGISPASVSKSRCSEFMHSLTTGIPLPTVIDAVRGILMKAVQFNEYGGTDVLKIVDIDPPHAGPGEVRIKVQAVGVNPIDWKIRAGYVHDFMPVTFPAGVGSEAAGIIDEVGEGVSGFAVGDVVFGYGRNTLAEQAVLRSWASVPRNMPIEVAGGLPVIVETATRILDHVNIKAGETLLITGAAGGVGSAAIQMALHRGAIVIGTASAPKHEYLRSLGAVPTTYEPGLAARVQALAPNGVNAALDLAGAGSVPELVAIVGDASRVVSISDVSAPQHGVVFSAKSLDHPERAFKEAARLYEMGALDLRIEQTFSLGEVANAQAISAAGRVTGKLVITLA